MDIKDYIEANCETCLYKSLPGSSKTCMRCLSKFNTCGIKVEYFPQRLEIHGVAAVPRDFDVTGCFIDQLKEELDKKVREKQLNTAFLTPNEMRRMFGLEEVKDETQTAKADAGKLDLTLVPLQIIEDIAEVREYGNKKYHDPDNWKTVDKQRYRAALFRHLIAYLRDPDGVDEESGIKHYKHMACNMAFLCEMEKEEKDVSTETE